MFADLVITVEEGHRMLPDELDSTERKFNSQRFLVNGFQKTRTKCPVYSDRASNDFLRKFGVSKMFSCFPAFLIHLLYRAFCSGFSQPGSCAMGTVGIDSLWINSSEVYSGGRGGGSGFCARAANSSGNFSTKLCVGHAHASPKAQMVRPAILSPMVFSVLGSSTTPPPRSMRSVIFCIQSEPSRHGVHWPQLSCA